MTSSGGGVGEEVNLPPKGVLRHGEQGSTDIALSCLGFLGCPDLDFPGLFWPAMDCHVVFCPILDYSELLWHDVHRMCCKIMSVKC